jgi:hypothetical protein
MVSLADIITHIIESIRDDGAGNVTNCLNAPVETVKGISRDSDFELQLSIEKSDVMLEKLMRRMSRGAYES